MAFAYKSLAAAQLPNAKATLYTSVGETALMQITLVVDAAGSYTVNIYLKRNGGSSKRLIPKDLPMDSADPTKAAAVDVLERPLEMSAGDVIEGDASAAASIDFTITGATR